MGETSMSEKRGAYFRLPIEELDYLKEESERRNLSQTDLLLDMIQTYQGKNDDFADRIVENIMHKFQEQYLPVFRSLKLVSDLNYEQIQILVECMNSLMSNTRQRQVAFTDTDPNPVYEAVVAKIKERKDINKVNSEGAGAHV